MKPDTTFIVSYPKSGRTWLRLLIGQYLVESYPNCNIEVENLDRLCKIAKLSKIVFTHAGSDLSNPKFTSAPELLRKYKSRRVLYLSRNVEDVMVSAFYQAKYRKNLFDGTFSEFLHDSKLGTKRFFEFMEMWSIVRNHCSWFRHVSYESLHADTFSQLSEILDLLGVNRNNENISNAVNFCAFNNLQALEKQGAFSKRRFQARDINRAETYKFRSGKIGDYSQHFSDQDKEFILKLLDLENSGLITSSLAGE